MRVKRVRRALADDLIEAMPPYRSFAFGACVDRAVQRLERDRNAELEAMRQTALDRMRAGAQGSFGYSLFAVSRRDLAKLQSLHLQYVRAMQDVIASSVPSDCVGLYCAQLLDLSSEPAGQRRP